MDTKYKKEFAKLGGLYEFQPQQDGSATVIENWTVDPNTGGWDNRIGYEKFFPNDLLYAPFNTHKRIHSLYIWSTHNGAKTYHLYEAEGLTSTTLSLRYTRGNVANAGSLVTLDSGRKLPTPDEPVTDYEPFGKYLIIVNGADRPIKFDGERITTLGWHSTPAAPDPWGVDSPSASTPNDQNMAINEYYRDLDKTAGLGVATNAIVNSYKWKISWLSESGSESPLSGETVPVSWTTDVGTLDRRHAVYLEGLAIGPEGTVARRIYRTKNLRDDPTVGAAELYYLVDQIDNNTESNYVDYKSDSQLGILAPDARDSITFPCPKARFSGTFKGCLFLDGGQSDENRLYYSEALHPDTFGALSFLELGSREGGGITGLFPYYNQLMVFRERAIEIVRSDSSGGFTAVPFIQGIGTTAIQTVTAVPNVGLMFLSNDGVYRVHGGMDGGSEIKLEKMTSALVKTVKRITQSTLSRATAVYSTKWREWHCYVPVDGSDIPSTGLVYHLDKDAWSTRVGFPVSAAAVDQRGEIIFGHNTGNNGAIQYESGLFVVSRARQAGYNVDIGGDSVSPSDPPSSRYKSMWHDFGSHRQKKFVKFVYLYVLTQGDATIPLNYHMDHDYEGTLSSGLRLQRADHPDQPVYGTSTWDSTVWQSPFLTAVRYPIAQKACSSFSFEISTTDDIVLVGYSLEFDKDRTSVVRGKR